MSRSILFTLTLAFWTLAGAAVPVYGQSLASQPRVAEALDLVEVWLEAHRAYEDIPGISVAVVHDQELVWSHGLGYRDLRTAAPATPETIYSICSISKLFTSIGVLQLRDQGRLRLDDPVENHLSWFAIRRAHAGAAPITVQGLLTHSSGLPREADFPYWSGPDFPFPTREEVIERLTEQETLYPASTFYQYSNLAFTLAGEVVAAASGRPYDTYMRQRILDPLGMSDTSPDIPEAGSAARLAAGYGRRMPGAERATIPPYKVRGIAPAAGFASTVLDLARFASWQFRLLESGDAEILSANTLREMHRVHWVDPDFTSHHGLGFSVSRTGDRTFVGHGGSCPGYRSQLLLQPDEKVATIVMANATGVNTGLLARRVFEIVAPAIAEAVADSGPPRAAYGDVPASEAQTADADLLRYVGTYRGFWGDAAVVPWRGGLAMVSLPTENPRQSLTRLEHVSEHTFRRIRDDGELGDAIDFDVLPSGRAVRLIRNSNPMERLP